MASEIGKRVAEKSVQWLNKWRGPGRLGWGDFTKGGKKWRHFTFTGNAGKLSNLVRLMITGRVSIGMQKLSAEQWTERAKEIIPTMRELGNANVNLFQPKQNPQRDNFANALAMILSGSTKKMRQKWKKDVPGFWKNNKGVKPLGYKDSKLKGLTLLWNKLLRRKTYHTMLGSRKYADRLKHIRVYSKRGRTSGRLFLWRSRWPIFRCQKSQSQKAISPLLYAQ